MAHSLFRVLLFSTVPWMTILWSLKILENKAPYILSIVIACMLALVYQCHVYPAYTTPFKPLPSLKSRGYLLGNHSRPIKWINGVFPQLCTEFGGEQIVRFYTLFNIELLMVVGPEAIAEICLHKSDGFTHSQEGELLILAALGHAGLFGARGQMHKRLRKIFAPVFTTATLATVCTNSLWPRCLAMVQEIDHHHYHHRAAGTAATPVQIGQWASTSILELVGVCILGQSAGWLARYPDLAATLTRRHANGQYAKAILPLFPRPVRSLLMLTLFGRRELSDLAYLESVAGELVQSAKEELGQQATSNSNGNSNSPPNLITAMLKDGNRNPSLSHEEILGHVSVFLAGGSETTSATFQWLIIELCRHPAVQSRLREEVRARWPTVSETKGNKNNNEKPLPLLSQIESIPYLRAVVDEVLRIHPATMVTQRQARQDMTITGIRIPKGTMLMIPPTATNLNTRIWGDDAAMFNPDRWLRGRPANNRMPSSGSSSKSNNQQACSIMTFGHGPQGCPGRSLARLMLMCMAAAFVSEYEVSLEDPGQSFVPTEALFTFPAPEVVVRLVKVSGP
ncbi:cytochrome P450 [Aspergillus carlsbadensis]|nr:cytochrome P450 [Aspergillus carlsbadensis]